MANEHELNEHETPGNATPAEPAASNAALGSRFNQMFPVLSQPEIDRVRRFGEVRRFPAGELLFHAGEAVPGMYLILSGRVAIEPRDGLGQSVPVDAFAQLIGAPAEEMTEVVPGEVIAEIGQLSGRPDLSVIDARAIEDVEAIVVPPQALRTLLVAEAELGERILRALILRRAALIELGFGGPVLVGPLKSPDVTRLSHFLERNSIPFRVVDPDHDRDAAALITRVAPTPGELPIAVLSDGRVLKNPTKHELAQALGLVATSFRREPYDLVIVGAGPAGLATAVYGASEGLAVLVLEAVAFGGQAGASARIENYLGFPTGVSGQALMARAFTQAQKFGAEFSLSTEVARLDCTESSGPDPTHVLELADGRQVRARAVVVATGARYRRPEIPNLAQFEGRGVSYWASPVEARLCRNEDVALLGGGNSAGQAAVFLASHARHVRVLVRRPGLSSTMSRYLIERIEGAPNITVLAETEIVELLGTPDQGLQGVRWRNNRTGAQEQHALSHLFLFTGADPATAWLGAGGIPIDDKGFILTGADVRSTERSPLPLETGVEGIFAVGDVRCGSVKRVGAAIGEGAAVVAQVHTLLARRDRTLASPTRASDIRSAG